MESFKRYERNSLVVLRKEFDDWAILFNPDTADIVGLNPIGVVVWTLIDGKKGMADIVSEIKKQFTDVPDNAEEEISIFLKKLHEEGFLAHKR